MVHRYGTFHQFFFFHYFYFIKKSLFGGVGLSERYDIANQIFPAFSGNTTRVTAHEEIETYC